MTTPRIQPARECAWGILSSSRWRIFYGYTISDTELSDISPNASTVILRSKDINLTSAADIALVRDTRDKLFAPTSGSRNSINVEYAGGPLGGDARVYQD